MIVLLSAFVAAQSAWDDPAPTGRWAASTSELASELLPPEMAADAVSHVVARGILEGGPPSSVRFEGRARPEGDGFCSRNSYYVPVRQVSASAEAKPEKPVLGRQLRFGDCNGIFAGLSPASSLDEGKAVLTWLGWAKRLAQGRSPLPFALTCKSETEQDKCANGARAALAALPLVKTTGINRDFTRQPHRWSVGVTETQPGQLHWKVEIDATPGASSIDLAWRIPSPF